MKTGMTFWKWIKVWFRLRDVIKEMNFGDEKRIMKFLKIGMRAWEKETRPVPGPELTSKTLVVLKMLNVIDKSGIEEEDKIDTIKRLLILNHKLGNNGSNNTKNSNTENGNKKRK